MPYLSNTVTKPERSLIAYAFLAQATRGEGDLMSGLAPVFKPIAHLHAGKRFDCNEFSKSVNEIYGLKIHPWAIEDIAPRLEKAGLLIKVQHTNDIHEYVYSEIPGDYDAVTEEDIRLVIHRFIEFAKPILQQHHLPIDEKALEDGFLTQLLDMNFIAVLLKPDRSKEDNLKQNTLTIRKPDERIEWEQTNAAHAKINVLCASFIVNAYHNDQGLYARVIQIATGALVSEVILNIQDPGNAISLRGLTIILDAPFLMSALDLSSEEAHTFSLDLCNQLREKGAQLAAFAHSVDELKDNLKAVISNVRSGAGFGATARRLSGKAFAAYASGALENPEVLLKQENVQIIVAPTSEDFFQFFSDTDQCDFQASLSYFENALAQERDAESIASTIRLRRGKRVKIGRFANSGYVFVTENPWIAEKVPGFLKRRNLYANGEVPPVVSARYLAGLVWVMFGGKGKDLPRHLLLANCAAAIEPRSDVVKQMHRFLSEVDTRQADFFHTLMTEERAGQHLMQLTLGDSALLNQSNAPAVLEQIKNSLIEKLETDKKAEIDSIKVGHEEQINKHRGIGERLRQELLDTGAANLQLYEKLKESNKIIERNKAESKTEKMERLQEKKKLIEKAMNLASKSESVAHMLIAIIIVVLGGLIAWFGLPDSTNILIKAIGIIASCVLAFLSYGKIIDYILGGYMTQLRDDAYRKKIAELEIGADEALFDLDWKSCSAVLREEVK